MKKVCYLVLLGVSLGVMAGQSRSECLSECARDLNSRIGRCVVLYLVEEEDLEEFELCRGIAQYDNQACERRCPTD